MNLKQYTYEIFKTNEANKGSDVLNVGLSMFMDDVTRGKRKYCPVNLDFAMLKEQYLALTSDQRAEMNKEIRLFIAHHQMQLCEAYPDRDKMLDIAAAADGI